MHVIIAGCGRVGTQIAESLSYENHDVVVIDNDAESFKRLGGIFHGVCVEGVAFDENTLLEAGARDADAFTAVTDHENTNIMSALAAKNLFSVPVVHSRLYDTEMEQTFSSLGVAHTCGTSLVVNKMMELLLYPEEVLVVYENESLGLRTFGLSVPSQAAGIQAGELNNGINLSFIALVRDNREIKVNKNTRLAAGDFVLLTAVKAGLSAAYGILGIGPAVDPLWQPKKPENTRIVVGGCSLVGALLARRLDARGFKVTVVDSDPHKSRRLHDNPGVEFIEGLICDDNTLLDAGIDEADAFTAVGKLDNENLLAAELAKYYFKVPRVVARLFNPDKESTYQALGTAYVCGTDILSYTILDVILHSKIQVRSPRVLLDYDLVEFEVPDKWDGATLGSLVRKTGITFVYVIRGATCLLPENDLAIGESDLIGALIPYAKTWKLERQMSKKRK
ncbi:MAG: NAD-binding protein [Actinobacteria bacterium]|nr:NAD-binding protein [Actinomycetota bacterium]